MNPSSLRVLFLGMCFCAIMVMTILAEAQDFTVDPDSPEVPARSPSDIYDSPGANKIVKAAQLGLNPNENIDAMSYGHDQIVPLGPFNFVTLIYSVPRGTVGHQGDGFAGGGAVYLQSTNNGAAGDKFFITAIGTPLLGMIPIARGLKSDAPMHNLTPLPPVQSDIDSLSGPSSNPGQPIYFSVDADTAAGRPNWSAADIFRVTPGGTPTIWAKATTLGLQGFDIDGLALRNIGNLDLLDPGDVVWVSLKGGGTIVQIYPTPVLVFTPTNLNVQLPEDVNAFTGWDPGPDTTNCFEGEKYPQPKQAALLSTVEVLTRRVVLKPLTGTVAEVVSVLEKEAERRFKIPRNVKLPQTPVKLGNQMRTIGEALNATLSESGWTFELDPEGQILLCPNKASPAVRKK